MIADAGIERARTSLWDLEQQLVELVDFRDGAEDEETRQAADQAIAEYVQREIAKVDGIRAYIRHCETMVAGAKEEESRQLRRGQDWQRRADVMKKTVFNIMTQTGKAKLEGRTGLFLVKGNGGKLPLLVESEALVPESFCDLVKVPRKDDIRRALESGIEVPGARIGERGTHLEVK